MLVIQPPAWQDQCLDGSRYGAVAVLRSFITLRTFTYMPPAVVVESRVSSES